MSFLKGSTLTLSNIAETKTVSWKQGSFLGAGGDKSETYTVCDYKVDAKEQFVTVFVQTSFGSPPNEMKVGSQLQYGMNDSRFFIVYHDKNNKPYQHRFIRNTMQDGLYNANEWTKKAGVDMSWAAGDYLRDF